MNNTLGALLGQVRGRTGTCAGCNRPFTDAMPSVSSGLLIEPQGSAGYQLCEGCTERRAGDRKFRRRLERDAYRTIFGAGPDAVTGGVQ